MGPELAWLHAVADVVIGVGCLAVATTLAVFMQRLRSERGNRAPIALGVFAVLGAALFLLDACGVFWPLPLADGVIRVVTALSAVAAALLLPHLAPRASMLAHASRLAHQRGAELDAALRELAAARAKSKELETQLFANVSHELRTPLALILGPTERLLGAPGLTPAQRADLEVVARNARSLLKHVGDLLDVAKSEAGKLAPVYCETDLAELVRATTAHFDGFASDRRIEYTIDASPPLPAELDTGKLQRALLNLLSNAFKFTPVGGRVRCTANATEDGRLVIEVADSGPGVPTAQRGAVFERFRQLETGATRRFGGTGLGLAIAKDFVELQRGRVSIHDAPEGGALLRIELPAHAPAGALVASPDDSAVMVRALVRETLDSLREPSEPPPASTREGMPLVLVVEDNPDMNRFVAATLAPDFRVVAASDGEKGLELALSLKPDLIVSDVMMPRMSGDVLVREVRARSELDGVPVILLTAKTDDALRVRLLREGAQDYLAKPFFAEELRARVKNLVTMKRVRDILQRDLASRTRDLESLAREVAQRRRELETALESARVARDHADRASAMKTSFLRMVSHELRTPLTSLKLNLERLVRSRDRSLTPRQHDMVRKIATSSLRLQELIESLLEYARIEGGRLRVEVEDFDPGALCEGVIEELSPQAEQKGIALRLVPAPGLPALRSDPRLVRLVVVNLVGNAVKFTHEGEVEVSLALVSGAHEFRVRDSGPGIPPEDHERIFEPFEQMEPIPNKHTRGVGLGLSIVKEMVEALSGRIELESAVGRGSTFAVTLPSLADVPARVEPEEDATPEEPISSRRPGVVATSG
ncbi:Periplasmic Sensor Hybrid Histidine Kinase [Minicystis rosea]|nr:Periplasmic Sensor Hybrid Histidine Kinase [Minicystis rosea]